MDKPKLSVYVITYNQEDVIRRTMDSLLRQKDYIYEICINDDCSKDHTFEILQEYQQKYPEIVKPVQNEHNLGIFENTEAVQSRLTGDMVYDLSGDDVCPDGYFKAVFDFIDEKKIDWRNELYCIYGDYKIIYPNGDTSIFSNDLVRDEKNVVMYSLLWLVGNRSCCFSSKVLRLFQKVSQGKSHIAETAQDIQLPFFSKKHYYVPIIGNIYYAGIGISTKMNKERYAERVGVVPYALDFLRKNGYIISKKELNFCNYNIAFKKRQQGDGCRHAEFYWYLRTYVFPFKIFKKSIKRFLFSIRHKLPHKKPILVYR